MISDRKGFVSAFLIAVGYFFTLNKTLYYLDFTVKYTQAQRELLGVR
jgi:hypothetical protein